MTRAGPARPSRGISTIEMLVGAMLSLLLAGVLYSFHRWQQLAFARQNTYAASQNVTRTAIDMMARELRMASYDPSAAALPAAGPCCPGYRRGIVDARRDRLQFRQDLNGDGDVADAGEDVVYDVAGEALRRTDGAGAADAIATGIPAGGLVLRYFDGSHPANELVPAGSPPALTTCQRDCVARVHITVRASLDNPDPNVATPVRAEASSEIAIRNRSLDNF
jgi:type IV pilus assembly protein PilW